MRHRDEGNKTKRTKQYWTYLILQMLFLFNYEFINEMKLNKCYVIFDININDNVSNRPKQRDPVGSKNLY